MLMKYWNLKLKIEKPSPKSARVFLSVERGIFDGYFRSAAVDGKRQIKRVFQKKVEKCIIESKQVHRPN